MIGISSLRRVRKSSRYSPFSTRPNTPGEVIDRPGGTLGDGLRLTVCGRGVRLRLLLSAGVRQWLASSPHRYQMTFTP